MATGGEAAGAAAAARAVAKAAGDDEKTKEAMGRAALDTPGGKKAVELRGQRMAVRQQLLLNIWRPLARTLGVSKEYFEGQFSSDMADKTSGIPDEHLTAPAAPLALPAMQALGWSLDEPNLKEMYLNLLAAASDGRRSDAHPSFAEVIKQLSPDEAGVLSDVMRALRNGPSTIVCIEKWITKGSRADGFITLKKHVLSLRRVEDTTIPAVEPRLTMWIENWARLGLVDVDYGVARKPAIAGSDPYAWVSERPEFLEASSLVPEGDPGEVKWATGLIALTDYGQSFRAAVSDPITNQPSEVVEEN